MIACLKQIVLQKNVGVDYTFESFISNAYDLLDCYAARYFFDPLLTNECSDDIILNRNDSVQHKMTTYIVSASYLHKYIGKYI